MKGMFAEIIIWAFIVLMLWLLISLSGCMVIWTDDVFIGTAFKAVDANSLQLIAEPNYLEIGGTIGRTKNDTIRLKFNPVLNVYEIETGGSP